MGDMLGGLFGGQTSGEGQQLEMLKQMTEGLRQYRPEAAQSRLNALSNVSTAYQPANNMLETMYGPPTGEKDPYGNPIAVPQRQPGVDITQAFYKPATGGKR